MNICIFCSANSNIPTEYFERTSELGTWMGPTGIRWCSADATSD